MSLPFSEQRVLISGASRGLGAAIARSFVREGAAVVVNYHRSEGPARALADELGPRAIALQADIRDPQAVQGLVARATDALGGAPTTVISNALVDYRFDPERRLDAAAIGWDAFDAQLQGSVRGALNLIQACLPAMRAAGYGRVVAIGSNLVQRHVEVAGAGVRLDPKRLTADRLRAAVVAARDRQAGARRIAEAFAAAGGAARGADALLALVEGRATVGPEPAFPAAVSA